MVPRPPALPGNVQQWAFTDAPLASPSGQFALGRPVADVPPPQEPSHLELRPWGLRHLSRSRSAALIIPPYRYDPTAQVAIGAHGVALVDGPLAGPPTAPSTSPVDGVDPPSSEDWVNDFSPDEPSQP
jgi:putative ATP-grasp target RiPP